MKKTFTILGTGGTGFIGSNFIHWLFGCADFQGHIINLAVLTYAGNLENLADIEAEYVATAEQDGAARRYVFFHGDICDRSLVDRLSI